MQPVYAVCAFTFIHGLNNKCFAPLLQCIGGGAGVSPWEQRGGDKDCFVLHALLNGMRRLPAVCRCGVTSSSAVHGQFSTHYEFQNLRLRIEECRRN